VTKALCQLPLDTSDVVQGIMLSINALRIHLRLLMSGARIRNGATRASIKISDDIESVRRYLDLSSFRNLAQSQILQAIVYSFVFPRTIAEDS
jgi:hypothetical protein